MKHSSIDKGMLTFPGSLFMRSFSILRDQIHGKSAQNVGFVIGRDAENPEQYMLVMWTNGSFSRCSRWLNRYDDLWEIE